MWQWRIQWPCVQSDGPALIGAKMLEVYTPLFLPQLWNANIKKKTNNICYYEKFWLILHPGIHRLRVLCALLIPTSPALVYPQSALTDGCWPPTPGTPCELLHCCLAFPLLANYKEIHTIYGFLVFYIISVSITSFFPFLEKYILLSH